MKIVKIISDEETECNQSDLDTVIEFDINNNYELMLTQTKNHLQQIEQNVVDSTATILFTYGNPTGDTKKTLEFTKKHGRPCHCVDLNDIPELLTIKIEQWLETLDGDVILNIAGEKY